MDEANATRAHLRLRLPEAVRATAIAARDDIELDPRSPTARVRRKGAVTGAAPDGRT